MNYRDTTASAVFIAGLDGPLNVVCDESLKGVVIDYSEGFEVVPRLGAALQVQPAGYGAQQELRSNVVRGNLSVTASGPGSIAIGSIHGGVTIKNGQISVGQAGGIKKLKGTITVTCGRNCGVFIRNCSGTYTQPDKTQGEMAEGLHVIET